MASTDDSKSFTLFTSSPFDGVKQGSGMASVRAAFKLLNLLVKKMMRAWDACTDVERAAMVPVLLQCIVERC